MKNQLMQLYFPNWNPGKLDLVYWLRLLPKVTVMMPKAKPDGGRN